uniref:Ovule protein n=1 Tax=Elaeophora elaphi TaxID=1147741 RepID=A0A0R3RMP6_9BILA
MSNKVREATVLRPSLKKQSAQPQTRRRDSDIKRHVTFVTPKLPPSNCNLPKQQSTSDQNNPKVCFSKKFSSCCIMFHFIVFLVHFGG